MKAEIHLCFVKMLFQAFGKNSLQALTDPLKLANIIMTFILITMHLFSEETVVKLSETSQIYILC